MFLDFIKKERKSKRAKRAVLFFGKNALWFAVVFSVLSLVFGISLAKRYELLIKNAGTENPSAVVKFREDVYSSVKSEMEKRRNNVENIRVKEIKDPFHLR